MEETSAKLSQQGSLLVSVLLSYPQISTVQLLHDRSIHLTVVVRRSIDHRNLAAFLGQIEQMLPAIASLQDRHMERFRIGQESGEEGMLFIRLERDLDTLDVAELNLLGSLATEAFGDHLVTEDVGQTDPEEQRWQRAMLEEVLKEARSNAVAHDLFAFRERGQILLFNRHPRRKGRTPKQ